MSEQQPGGSANHSSSSSSSASANQTFDCPIPLPPLHIIFPAGWQGEYLDELVKAQCSSYQHHAETMVTRQRSPDEDVAFVQIQRRCNAARSLTTIYVRQVTEQRMEQVRSSMRGMGQQAQVLTAEPALSESTDGITFVRGPLPAAWLPLEIPPFVVSLPAHLLRAEEAGDTAEMKEERRGVNREIQRQQMEYIKAQRLRLHASLPRAHSSRSDVSFDQLMAHSMSRHASVLQISQNGADGAMNVYRQIREAQAAARQSGSMTTGPARVVSASTHFTHPSALAAAAAAIASTHAIATGHVQAQRIPARVISSLSTSTVATSSFSSSAARLSSRPSGPNFGVVVDRARAPHKLFVASARAMHPATPFQPVCTYTSTQRVMIMQAFYTCLTCNPLGGQGICEDCLLAGCHEGHILVNKRMTSSYCDCGPGDINGNAGRCLATQSSAQAASSAAAATATGSSSNSITTINGTTKEQQYFIPCDSPHPSSSPPLPLLPSVLWSVIQSFLPLPDFVHTLAVNKQMYQCGQSSVASVPISPYPGSPLADDDSRMLSYLLDADPAVQNDPPQCTVNPLASFQFQFDAKDETTLELWRSLAAQRRAKMTSMREDARASSQHDALSSHAQKVQKMFPEAHQCAPINHWMKLWASNAQILIDPLLDFPAHTLDSHRNGRALTVSRANRPALVEQHVKRVENGEEKPSLMQLEHIASTKCRWLLSTRSLVILHNTKANVHPVHIAERYEACNLLSEMIDGPVELVSSMLSPFHHLQFLSLSSVCLTRDGMSAIAMLPQLIALKIDMIISREEPNAQIRRIWSHLVTKGLLLDEAFHALCDGYEVRLRAEASSYSSVNIIRHLKIDNIWPATNPPPVSEASTFRSHLLVACCRLISMGLHSLHVGDMSTVPPWQRRQHQQINETYSFMQIIKGASIERTASSTSSSSCPPPPPPLPPSLSYSLHSLCLGPMSCDRSDLLIVLEQTRLPLRHLEIISDIYYQPATSVHHHLPVNASVHLYDSSRYNGDMRMQTYDGLWMKLCNIWKQSLTHLHIAGIQVYDSSNAAGEAEFSGGLSLLTSLRSLYMGRQYNLSGVDVISACIPHMGKLRVLSLCDKAYHNNLRLTDAFIDACLQCPSLRRLIYGCKMHLQLEGLRAAETQAINSEILERLAALYVDVYGKNLLRIAYAQTDRGAGLHAGQDTPQRGSVVGDSIYW